MDGVSDDPRRRSFGTAFFVLLLMISIGFGVSYFQSGVTGSSVVVNDSVACSFDSQCSDGISCTRDVCKNPGSSDSFCVNEPVDECVSGDGCCPSMCSEDVDSDC